MTYSITLISQLRAMRSFLIQLVIISFILLFNPYNHDVLIGALCIFLLTAALPTFILHIEYLNENLNHRYDISAEGIKDIEADNTTFLPAKEMAEITIYMCPNVYYDSARRLAHEDYHFARIIMKDGSKLVLTSLLTPKLEDAIKQLNVSYNKEKRLFCNISSR